MKRYFIGNGKEDLEFGWIAYHDSETCSENKSQIELVEDFCARGAIYWYEKDGVLEITKEVYNKIYNCVGEDGDNYVDLIELAVAGGRPVE